MEGNLFSGVGKKTKPPSLRLALISILSRRLQEAMKLWISDSYQELAAQTIRSETMFDDGIDWYCGTWKWYLESMRRMGRNWGRVLKTFVSARGKCCELSQNSNLQFCQATGSIDKIS